ncbi:MAG TPA: polysaccharide deacetylase family protein [Desulfosalsimonadaceae bacterium]|nr:polysaccharide deacetylase family protein [Desulfosalsimonadaceae bacterium]
MSRKKRYTACMAVFLAVGLAWLGLQPACGPSGQKQGKKSMQGQIRAFVYHHVGMDEKYPSTSVSEEQFRRQLAYLKNHDYTVLPLGRALDLLYSGKKVPEKTAVITLDDGYRSVWENALPLLEQFGYRATIFVATANVGGSNYMNWEQITKLQQRGFEIGNHSHSHAYFVNKPREGIKEAFEADLQRSHELFRRHLNKVPELYAYPFGEYCPEMAGILKEYDYQAAAAQRSGVIYGGSSRFALPRFPMNLRYGRMEAFARKVRMNALRVAAATPKSPLVAGTNPPGLKLRIANSAIDPAGLQCFVNGQRTCTIGSAKENGALFVTVRAREKLSSRRSLYTITAPSKDGSRWFWYSHPWVIPAIDGRF